MPHRVKAIKQRRIAGAPMLMATRQRKNHAVLWAMGMVIAAAIGFSLPVPSASAGAPPVQEATVVAAH
jgi:hypothetical protein